MKKIIYKISPFNNCMEMSNLEYVIKKVLAFVFIYCMAALLGEGIIIGLLYGKGYDPLHGEMPTGLVADLLPYYGFIVFLLVTGLYCKVVEKRSLKVNGFAKKISDYLWGILLSVLLLFIIVGFSCVIKAISFKEFNLNVNMLSIFLWLFAFIIQGAAEEVMCRGFLMSSLQKKVPVSVAIIISSTAFAFPHVSSLLEADLKYVIIGIINLYLVSVIFSLLALLRSNIWISCGLHSSWNFILYGIMGLSLSGSEAKSDSMIQLYIKKGSIFNGAEYGIEASIITSVVLGIFAFCLIKKWKGKACNNGISQ